MIGGFKPILYLDYISIANGSNKIMEYLYCMFISDYYVIWHSTTCKLYYYIANLFRIYLINSTVYPTQILETAYYKHVKPICNRT